jgi:hypothetical protein
MRSFLDNSLADRWRETVNVAPTSSLLYRSASSLRPSKRWNALDPVHRLPIGNRRHSRLEACATPPAFRHSA